jgi:hypothetical protein
VSSWEVSPDLLRDEPLVTIARFETLFEASLARGALEAIGIRALVPREETGPYSTHQAGFVSIELQVFASEAQRAEEELRRIQMRLVEPPSEEEE